MPLADASAGEALSAAAAEFAGELDGLVAGVAELARRAGLDPLDLAAAGGEDYELLAALAPDDLDRARELVGSDLWVIGAVADGGGVVFSGPAGGRPPRGFDQLGHRRAPRGPA